MEHLELKQNGTESEHQSKTVLEEKEAEIRNLQQQVQELQEKLISQNQTCAELEILNEFLKKRCSVREVELLTLVEEKDAQINQHEEIPIETTEGTSTGLVGDAKEESLPESIVTPQPVDDTSGFQEITSDSGSSTGTVINLSEVEEPSPQVQELQMVLAETQDVLADVSMKYYDLQKEREFYEEESMKEIKNIREQSQNQLEESAMQYTTLEAVYSAKAKDLCKAYQENYILTTLHESILLDCQQKYVMEITELKLANEKNIEKEHATFAVELQELKQFYDEETKIKDANLEDIESKYLRSQEDYQTLLTSKANLQLEFDNLETEMDELSVTMGEIILTAENANFPGVRVPSDHELLQQDYKGMIANFAVCQTIAKKKQEELNEATKTIEQLTIENENMQEQTKKLLADTIMKSVEAKKECAEEINNMSILMDEMEGGYIEIINQIKSSYEQRLLEASTEKESVTSLKQELLEAIIEIKKLSKEIEVLQDEKLKQVVDTSEKSSGTDIVGVVDINQLGETLTNLAENQTDKITNMEDLHIQKIKELEKIQSDLLNANSVLQIVVDELNLQVETFSSDTENLLAEVRRLEAVSEELSQEKVFQEQKIEELEKIELDLVKENHILQNTKSKEVQDANSRIEELNTQNRNLEAEVLRIQAKSDELFRVTALSEQKIKDLEKNQLGPLNENRVLQEESSRIEVLSAQNEKLQAELEENQDELSWVVASYEQKLEELYKEQDDLNFINKELHQSMESGGRGDHSWKEKTQSLTNIITMQKKEILAHEDRISELETDVQDRNEQNKKLTLELNGKNKLTEDNAEELIKVTGELCETNKKFEECSKEVTDLTAMLVEKKKDIEEKTQELEKLTAELCEANKKIVGQAGALAEIQELFNKKKSFEDKSEELKKLTVELCQANKKIEDQAGVLAEIKELMDEKKGIIVDKTEELKLTAELCQANKKIENQAAELAQMHAYNQLILNNLSLNGQQLFVSQKIIKDITVKHRCNELGFKNKIKELKDNLTARDQQLLETRDKLRKRETVYEIKLNSLQSELKYNEKQLVELQMHLAQVKDTYNTTANSCRHTIKELEWELGNKDSIIDQLSRDIAYLKQHNAKQKEKFQKQRSELTQLQAVARYFDGREDTEEMVQAREQYYKQITDFENKICSLECTNEKLVTKVESLQATIPEKDNVIESLKTDLANALAQVTDSWKVIKEMEGKDQPSQMQSILKSREFQIKGLFTVLNCIHSKLDGDKGILDQLNKLKEENAAFTRMVQEASFLSSKAIDSDLKDSEASATVQSPVTSKIEESEDVPIVEQELTGHAIRRWSDPFRARRSMDQDSRRHLDDMDISCEGCLRLRQKIRTLEATIKEKAAENKSLDNKVAECAEELESLQTNIRSLETRNASLQTAADLQEKTHKVTIEQQTKIDELTETNRHLNNEVLGAVDEMRSLRENIKSVTYKHLMAKKKTEELRKQVEALKKCKKCDELKTMITVLDKQIAECSGCASLGKTVNAHETKIASLKNTIQKMEMHKKEDMDSISQQVDVHIRHCLIYIDNLEKFVTQRRPMMVLCEICIDFKDTCKSIGEHIKVVKSKFLYAEWIYFGDKAESIVPRLIHEIEADSEVRFDKNDDYVTQFSKLRRKYIAKILGFISALDSKLVKVCKNIKDRSLVWSDGDHAEGISCTCNLNECLCNILLNLKERLTLSLKLFYLTDLELTESFKIYNKLIETLDINLTRCYSDYEALYRIYGINETEDSEAAEIIRETGVQMGQDTQNYEYKYMISSELCRVRKNKINELALLLKQEGYDFKYLEAKKQTVIVKESAPQESTVLYDPYAIAVSISSRLIPARPPEAAPTPSTSSGLVGELSRELRSKKRTYQLSTDTPTTKK